MADDIPTEDELMKLRVIDLRKKLSSLALPTGGNKADLVARLHSHYVEHKNTGSPAGGSPAVDEEQSDVDDTEDMTEAEGEPSEQREDEMNKEAESVQLSGEDAERQAREEAEREAKAEAEIEARAESEREAKEVAEREAKEVAEREAKEVAERQAQEEAERQAKEAERQAKEEAERQAEADRQTKAEAERQAKQKAERQAILDQQKREAQAQREVEERAIFEAKQRALKEEQLAAAQREALAKQEEERNQREVLAAAQRQEEEAQQMLIKQVMEKEQQAEANRQRALREQQLAVEQQKAFAEQALQQQRLEAEKQQLAALRVEQQMEAKDQTDDKPEGAAPPAVNEPLPAALENLFTFKDKRVEEVGSEAETMQVDQVPTSARQRDPVAPTQPLVAAGEDEEDDADEEAGAAGEKLSKNKLRKKKKKTRAQRRTAERQAATERATAFSEVAASDVDSGVEVEYIQEAPLVDRSDPLYSQFSKIFETFKIDESSSEVKTETLTTEVKSDKKELVEDTSNFTKRGATHFGELEGTEPVVDKSKLSKKQLKKLTRMSVAELKTVVSRPDLVEMHDVTGPDPKLLLSLKATRNTVPVPRHWCNKRKYLQGKRGVEKPPFELPDYIVATGIMEMRQALAEKEEEKSLKQKMREKVRPKMGKIDIDYQKLHDAFFKHQRRPKITMHGELYYEGKEFETKLKEKKPGNLSDTLRSALGMPIGAGAEKFPPPWLIAMQRYGPPPSYPNLKIAGLNAAIPDGCLFGYHAGGWGKPPVDETGRPLYGDVFGQQGEAAEALPIANDAVDMTAWGEMESDSSEEEDSSDESGDDGERDDLADGLVTPADAGLITPSGMTSIPAGMETPDAIELRKRIEESMDVGGGDTPSLYQVLPEKRANVGAAMMGSAHTYDVGGAKRFTSEGIEIALNPEELDLDNVAMQAKYDQTVRAQQADATNEDLSDMVAEHAAKAAKKRKKQQATDKASKKHKEFKF